MSDLYLKGFVSIVALYAAANPWFRHHNVVRPGDLAAVVLLVALSLVAVGRDFGVALWFAAAAIVALAVAFRIASALRKRSMLLTFGCGRRNAAAVHDAAVAAAPGAGIDPGALVQNGRRPWLIRLEGVSAARTTRFARDFDKVLRPVLRLEFRRIYPATLAVLAFLAYVWRYL